MITPDSQSPSAGSHRFSEAVRTHLRAEDFAEKLRVQLLEQVLRAKMLGMSAEPVRLGRWELRAAIDQGAMGAVFRAFDPTLRCEVAIKLLICPDGADLEERRARMESEAQAMAQLRHTNVLRVQNFVPASSDAFGAEVPSYLVMDFIEGTTLLAWQRESNAGWREIVEKYAQVAAGLAHIHENDLVHRDIKPANILVRKTGEVIIGDFGLVHDADREAAATGLAEELGEDGPLTASDRLTQKGALLGTLAYMAPEQLRDGTTSARSDQFSFFVALYEALYGSLPFTGETRSDLLASTHRDRPAFQGQRQAPRWLRRLVAKGLAVDPDDRHASMNLVAKALADGLKPFDRGRLWMLAGGAITGGAIAGMLAFTDWHEDPCDRAGDLDGWSPPRQALAHSAFLTTGAEGSEAAWSRFHDRVGRYARSWSSLKESTCEVLERSDDEGGAEADLARRRDACLDESSALLAEFMERYRAARAEDVLYSEDAAFELQEGLRRCESDFLLRQGPAPAPVADAFRHVRDQLASALTLEIDGSFERAVEVAEEALATAVRLGDSSLEAQASFRLGRINSLLRHDERAVELLHRAFTLANAIARDDIAADAMVELIKVLTLDTGDLQRANELDAIAESFVERLSSEDPRRSAAVAEARGILAREQKRREDAIAFHRRALGKRRSQRDTSTRDHIRSNVNLANALTLPGFDEAALTEARDLYEQAITRALVLGESHPLTANARRAYAGFLRQIGEFSAAKREAEASLAAAQRVYGENSTEAAVLHVLLGTLAAETLLDDELDTEHLAPAQTHLKAALNIFERESRPGFVDSEHISALHLSAELHRLAGEVTEAIADYDRAITILRPLADHQDQLADTLGYLGELLVDAARPADALPKLREASELVTLRSGAPEESHALLLSAMAVAQAETGDLPGARRTAQNTEALAKELDLDGDILDLINSRLDPILNSKSSFKEEKKERSHGSL